MPGDQNTWPDSLDKMAPVLLTSVVLPIVGALLIMQTFRLKFPIAV